jgi:hypothetical protein
MKMNNLPDPQALDAAQLIWSYHCLDETIPNEDSTVDLIIGLGSYDTRVAVVFKILCRFAIS